MTMDLDPNIKDDPFEEHGQRLKLGDLFGQAVDESDSSAYGEVDVYHCSFYRLMTQNPLQLMYPAAGPQVHGGKGVPDRMGTSFSTSHAGAAEHSLENLLDSIQG